MRILIHDVEAPGQRRDLRELAVKQTGLVTRRLRWLLPRITLVLSRVSARPGDVDKRCVVEMKSRRRGTVVITALARDWLTAMTSALRLAGRRLSEGLPNDPLAAPQYRVRAVPVLRTSIR